MGYMTLGYENIITIGLALIGFVIVLVAQVRINSTYNKTKTIACRKGFSGQEVARMILDQNGLGDVHVVETKGTLTDHYDPNRKVVRLSTEIFHGTSIASISVAAHECGHAIQDKENYSFMRIRSALVPFVNLVSYLGYFAVIVSLIAGITGYLMIGILILLATILFQLVTLPVEFDASKRAGIQLEQLQIVNEEEQDDVKNMLGAAAMTYVASLVSSVLNLLRLILMFQDRDD